jgi:hypothetical protein
MAELRTVLWLLNSTLILHFAALCYYIWADDFGWHTVAILASGNLIVWSAIKIDKIFKASRLDREPSANVR